MPEQAERIRHRCPGEVWARRQPTGYGERATLDCTTTSPMMWLSLQMDADYYRYDKWNRLRDAFER